MWGNLSDIGGIIKPVAAVVANSSGTTNSSAIDRQGYESCVLFHACGAATGSPSAQTADSKLQDSADGSTSWADISGAAWLGGELCRRRLRTFCGLRPRGESLPWTRYAWRRAP